MCTKEEIISCRSARNDKTSTTARSYFQGPEVRPRLPKNLYTLSFSLLCRYHFIRELNNPFIFLCGGVSELIVRQPHMVIIYKHILYRNCPIFWTGNKKLIPTIYIQYTHQLSTAFLTTWIVFYTQHRVHFVENTSINDIVENILNRYLI